MISQNNVMECCATGLNFSLLLYSFTGLVEGGFCSTKIWNLGVVFVWLFCGECKTSAPSGTEVRLWIVGSIWKENDRGGVYGNIDRVGVILLRLGGKSSSVSTRYSVVFVVILTGLGGFGRCGGRGVCRRVWLG